MTETKPLDPSQKRERVHLEFLDGMRGLAAMIVLLGHVGGDISELISHRLSDPGAPALFRFVILFNYTFNDYGHVAVVVFIVLSGYCLSLPTVSRGHTLQGGLVGFVRRRAKRILPPYYAALAIGVLILAVVPAVRPYLDHRMSLSLHSYSVGSVVSHLLLVHNWTPWLFGVNPILWSIAVEWQIYFVFALVLLPVSRRFGVPASLVTGLGLGIVVFSAVTRIPFLAHSQPLISQASPWMVGCFAVGMAVAYVRGAGRWHTALGAAIFLLSSVYLVIHFHSKVHRLQSLDVVPDWFPDYLMAAAAACLILGCAHASDKSRLFKNMLHLLESRPAMFLGVFSYSLYLLHGSFLALTSAFFTRLSLTAAPGAICLLCVDVLGSILAAYLFHLAFERPFMSKRTPRTERQAEVAAITNPAP